MSDTQRIRKVLKTHARLGVDVDTLAEDTALRQAGLTSLATVNVMLALEAEFDVEFPDRMLSAGVFESIATMQAALAELTA